MATDQHEFLLENFILIYLDNEENNCLNVYFLQSLVHLIFVFTNCDQCFDYITDIRDERIFLIISDNRYCRQHISIINEFEQIESIYLISKKRSQSEKWIENHPKIKGVYTDIQTIYDAVRRDLREYQDDRIPISILPSKSHVRDQLFEINEFFKENYQTQTKDDFIELCQNYYANNEYQLEIIKQFQNTYLNSIPWFTRDCFLTNVLHKALRTRNMSIIKQLDFFIRNLHEQIQSRSKPAHLIVYRNQMITRDVFDRILKNPHGFLVFHHFLILTTDRELAFAYADVTQTNDFVRILFEIKIDEQIMSLNDQYLLTINTIFQICAITSIKDNLWSIKLKQTNSNEF